MSFPHSARNLLTLALALLLSATSHGALMTYTATDSGTYSQSGAHSTGNTAFTAGYSSFLNTNFRNFFVFDFGTGISPTIVNSATLQINSGAGPANGNYSLFSIDNSISALVAGSGVSGYTDLGQGTSFATAVFTGTTTPANTNIDIALNPAAVGAVNILFNNGGLWALGGAFDAANARVAPSFMNFLGTDNLSARLILDVEDRPNVVPEPQLGAVIALAGIALFGLRRRRH